MNPQAIPVAPAQVDERLQAHGLRRTAAARQVLGWFLAHPDTAFTHADLQAHLSAEDGVTLDRVTLYRLVDRLTLAGLLLCRVDARRVRRFQAMPDSVLAAPHFECQSCHRDRPLTEALRRESEALEQAARSAVDTLQQQGYQGVSVELAVRGVCADCASPPPGR